MSWEVVEIERKQRQRDRRINGESWRRCLHDGNERPNAVSVSSDSIYPIELARVGALVQELQKQTHWDQNPIKYGC